VTPEANSVVLMRLGLRRSTVRFQTSGSHLQCIQCAALLFWREALHSLGLGEVVERGASALRRLVPHVGSLRSAERAGRGSQGCLLCSSGGHRFANFQSYRFIVASLSDLQLIAAKAPSGPALPGLGGVYFFCVACRPRRWLKEGRSRLFDGRTWAVSMSRP
jgi:hypothetical protein